MAFTVNNRYGDTTFKDGADFQKFDRDFKTTATEFFDVYNKVERRTKEEDWEDVVDILLTRDDYNHEMNKYGYIKSARKLLRDMRRMIDKYKYPHSDIRKKLIMANKGKLVSQRTQPRGIDIVDFDKTKDTSDIDNVVIDRDQEEYRKKRSVKSKPKRKIVKKCKCK